VGDDRGQGQQAQAEEEDGGQVQAGAFGGGLVGLGWRADGLDQAAGAIDQRLDFAVTSNMKALATRAIARNSLIRSTPCMGIARLRTARIWPLDSGPTRTTGTKPVLEMYA
jgi:hypothetical protein